MSQLKRNRRHPLLDTLLLDLLFDRRTRPLFIYAAITITIGAAFYRWQEGWDWLDSFYFVVISLTTVGYGDFVPTKPLSKLFTIFYGINGIVLLLMLFDVIRTARGWHMHDVRKEPSNPPDDE